MAKSLFASRTVWAAAVALWVSVEPVATLCLNEARSPNVAEAFHLLGSLVAAIATLYGRYAADGPVFTPDWMMGKSAPDLSEEETATTHPIGFCRHER